jgi:YegS/Rv2252/BmrU family lipid kinase
MGNGAKAAVVARDLLVEWLGESRVEFVLTEAPGHATEIARACPVERAATVFALGGDGIAHEVVNGLMQVPRESRPAFGLIPMGSGNDLARTIGMSESVPDAIVQFLDATERAFDIGCCNGEYFDETLSFGLDAAIALDTNERRKRTGQRGTVLYLSSGIDQLLHHLDLFYFHAILDGEREIEGAIHMLAVQNGPTYGGGFRICPEADPSDGILDICYADGPLKVPVATFKFLRAKDAHHTKLKGIHFERAASIELTFDKRPPCQFDGEEHIGDGYHISVEHKAIDVLYPKQG